MIEFTINVIFGGEHLACWLCAWKKTLLLLVPRPRFEPPTIRTTSQWVKMCHALTHMWPQRRRKKAPIYPRCDQSWGCTNQSTNRSLWLEFISCFDAECNITTDTSHVYHHPVSSLITKHQLQVIFWWLFGFLGTVDRQMLTIVLSSPIENDANIFRVTV